MDVIRNVSSNCPFAVRDLEGHTGIGDGVAYSHLQMCLQVSEQVKHVSP